MTRKIGQRAKVKELSKEEIARLEGLSIDDLKIEKLAEHRRIKELIAQREKNSGRSPEGGALDDGKISEMRFDAELQKFNVTDREIERIIQTKREAGAPEKGRKSDEDEKIERLITSWEKQFPKKEFMFRGQQSNEWDVASTLYRSLRKIRDEAYLPKMEKKILAAGRYVNPPHTLDAEIITDLQHFGGMTNCIDFTKEIHVALYFACKSKCGTGEILIIRRRGRPTVNPAEFDAVTSYDSKCPIRVVSPSARDANIDRVSSQGSIFLQVKSGVIKRSRFTKIENLDAEEKDFKIISIKKEEKQGFLEYLERYYVDRYWGILQDTMGIIDKDRSFKEIKETGGDSLSKLKQYDSLEGKFRELVALASNEVKEKGKPLISSHYYIGRIFYSRGNYKQAINSLRRAAHRSDQEPPHLHLFLASAFIRLGEYQAAGEQLAKVKNCDRGHLYYFIAADMHFQMDNYPCAWREIKKAVEMNEGSWSYLRLKIVIASKLPCASEVEKCAGQYLKNCFHDPDIAKLYENAKKGLQLHSDCGTREHGEEQ